MPDRFLTKDELMTFSRSRPDATVVRDAPEGKTEACAYCGTQTLMVGYSTGGRHWPACCVKPECLEKWEPDA